MRWAAATVLVVVAVLAASCSDAEPRVLPPFSVSVQQADLTETVELDPGQTVGDALEEADVTPVDGQVVSAGTGTAIEPNGDLAVVQVDGDPVPLDGVLQATVTIEVIDGTDTTEDTTTERRALAPGGLPDAMQFVQHVGKPGVEEVTVGVMSGEEVSAETITPPVPAHRATGKVVALTFDDGPSPTYTPEVLKILEEKQVTATFCQVGSEVEQHPELAKQVLEEGHVLCNHTHDHVEGLENEPRATVEAQIQDGSEAIEQATGEAPVFYRPPGGSLAPVIYDVTAAQRETVLYWSSDPEDWKRPPPDEILLKVVAGLEPGGIILLHDGGGNRDSTLAALPKIIDAVLDAGYTFVAPISGRPQVG